MKNLSELLLKEKKLPMHMPGHKRNTAEFPYLAEISAKQDITEITGYDNLHDAHGILQTSMERAARMRGAKRAFYLVNGSTCGILAAVCACVPRNGKLIMARNCHKSVYNAAELICADAVYLMPEKEPHTGGYGCVLPETAEKAVRENPDASLIVLTSPTYEGIISDVEKICKIAHDAGIPVLIDGAHGAHLGLDGFSSCATACGADISVESLHKTLPSLTQTAICYTSGDLVNADRLSEKLAVFETSSPSYLLLASIDGCVGVMEKNTELFAERKNALEEFYKTCARLKNIHFLKDYADDFYAYDSGKIVIMSEKASGGEIFRALAERGIECEMYSARYCLAMTGLGDTRESLMCLARALAEIDAKLFGVCPQTELYPPLPEKAMGAFCADGREKEFADIDNSQGKICGEYVWAYPPGVPVLVPGERISCEAEEVLKNYARGGVELKSARQGKIAVLAE